MSIVKLGTQGRLTQLGGVEMNKGRTTERVSTKIQYQSNERAKQGKSRGLGKIGVQKKGEGTKVKSKPNYWKKDRKE